MMTNKDLKESYKTDQFVCVNLHQIDLPDIFCDYFSQEVLSWLVMDSLSTFTLEIAAKKRIHVIAKPRSKNKIFLVVGGFLYYYQLLASHWEKEIECIIDWDASPKDVGQYFLRDIHLTIFSVKGGAISAAAKAALLVELSEFSRENGFPLGVQAPFGLIQMANQAALKELVGFDARGYKQASKKGLPPQMTDKIESILRLSRPVASSKIIET